VTTAVDAGVLLDVLLDDPRHRDRSLLALKSERQRGGLLVCPVVWAVAASVVREPDQLAELLRMAGVSFDPFDRRCSELAADSWRRYRRMGGRRAHVLSDFMVGAHAQARGGRLLSRERGFYRRYFQDLEVIEPAAL
jgi:predicted nucleic acid-binding protein